MSACKIGDLVRYSLDDVKDEFGVSPSVEILGLVIDETCVVDSDDGDRKYSYLTIFWSDGSLSYSSYESVPLLERLTIEV